MNKKPWHEPISEFNVYQYEANEHSDTKNPKAWDEQRLLYFWVWWFSRVVEHEGARHAYEKYQGDDYSFANRLSSARRKYKARNVSTLNYRIYHSRGEGEKEC